MGMLSQKVHLCSDKTELYQIFNHMMMTMRRATSLNNKHQEFQVPIDPF